MSLTVTRTAACHDQSLAEADSASFSQKSAYAEEAAFGMTKTVHGWRPKLYLPWSIHQIHLLLNSISVECSVPLGCRDEKFGCEPVDWQMLLCPNA